MIADGYNLDLRNPLKQYYGASLARLKSIKAAMDPADRFQPTQGI